MSCDKCAVRIKQRYEPIRILRAERVVQAAGNIEPVIADQFFFHDDSPIPDAIKISTIRGARAARLFPFRG